MSPFHLLDLGRCRIVPFSAQHLHDRYVSWLNDPSVVRWSEQRHRIHTLESCRAYATAMEAGNGLFLAIEAYDAALGHVGNITVALDEPNNSADVSIMIGEAAARGTGIGRLAWTGIVGWLLADGGVRRVTAGTMATNHAMIALMKHAGMTIESVRSRAFLCEGAEIDLVQAVRFA